MFYICPKTPDSVWRIIDDSIVLALIEQYKNRPYTFLNQLKNNQNISFDLSDMLYIKWIEDPTIF